MKRRQFVYTAGAAIVAGATISAKDLWVEDKTVQKRELAKRFEQAVLKGIAYGLHAPNPHNTQAWKFTLLSDTEMLMFVDEKRVLPETDPTTRQIHIGCGCFLECSKIGMTIEGFRTEIEFFPGGLKNYSRDAIGKAPIAKISYIKDKNTKLSPLTEYLFTRSTSRLMYSNSPVAVENFEVMKTFIQAQHSEIDLVTNREKLDLLLPILAEGMKIETYTFRTHEESRKWFRENDERIEQERDGINLPGNGLKGIKKWIAEGQLKGLGQKNWHAKKMNEYALDTHFKRVLSSPGMITVKTPRNTFQDWLYAGMEYLRLQLACCKYNYYIHPLSQVLQEFDEMQGLRMRFEEEMRVKGEEKIQMVVRVGRSKKPYFSFRRPVQDLVNA